MIKTTEDIIYNSCKSRCRVYKSKKFLEWVKEKYPYLEFHHGLGSYGKAKRSDYIGLPLTRAEHIQAEQDKSGFFIDHLPEIINIMQDYINFLEQRQR